jgi:hypothetical protein
VVGRSLISHDEARLAGLDAVINLADFVDEKRSMTQRDRHPVAEGIEYLATPDSYYEDPQFRARIGEVRAILHRPHPFRSPDPIRIRSLDQEMNSRMPHGGQYSGALDRGDRAGRNHRSDELRQMSTPASVAYSSIAVRSASEKSRFFSAPRFSSS